DLSGFGSEYTETKGKDSYTFIESYSRITINGVMANDNDFNMVRNSKIELVRTNKFNTEKDIYEAYHDKAFPLKNRVSLDVSNKGLYPDPSKVGEYMVKIIINNESENLSGKDDVKIEKVSTANYKSNIEEMLQNSVTYEPKKNVVNLSLSFDNLDENGNGSITRYNKIKMSQTESTVSLDMSWDVVSVSEYLESSPTEGKDINILTFKNIYQEKDVDKNGILSYVTKAKQTKDNVKTENSAQVFMDLGNGVKMPISEKFTTVDNYEMVIRAELSEIFTLNKLGTSGASQEQARILIISQYYQKDGDIEDANYDDIYLIKGDTELTMYYLGNIVYSFNDEYTERNEFFFPIPTSEGLKIREYENNVIPLNLIKDIDVLAGLPDSNIIVNKIYGGIITSATIKLATKEMESKNIEYCIRDKSVEGDADANFQIDKVENKKSTTFDIQVDVTGLNTGLENIAVNLICYQEEGAPSTQGYENVVAAEGLNENTYQVSNLVEDSKHEVYEADNVTLKGYEKHFYLQINGESRLYTFEYNLEKELIGVVEVIELTGQNINYGPDGEVIGYITIENEFENDIMWYKKDFVEDITYYSFTDPNEAGGSPIICSLPGIYNFEYKSGDKTITATINNKEKVGLQKIVFDCETNYFAVKQLIYTQNVMNVDGSFDLYTITEDYLTKLQVKIENSDNLNSAEITFEVDDRETPSMTYVSEATINSYLKTVNLSDVMAYGEEYIIAYLNQAMGTGEKYLRKIDLIEIKMFET
ncbi:MAG: hypothetical protein J6Q51_03565, partial [Clostridia bacterium]|nr:hypothetical protein [Clostridia bacterium]